MIKLNVEELLKKNNMSKETLCKKMNITRWNLNQAIRGHSNISYKYLEGFKKHLNCSFDDLLKIIDDEND